MKLKLHLVLRPCTWFAPAAILRAGATAVGVLLLAGCGSSAPASAAKVSPGVVAKGATGALALGVDGKPTQAVALVKSTFHVDPKFGRDPFFPASRPELGKQEQDAAPTAPLPLLSYLKLVGIRAGTARPMALINRLPIAQGEEGQVSIVLTNRASVTEVQKINIRCLEVRRDSVLISIAGEQGVRELRMAQAK
jgi:hypothetical protein